MIFHHAVPIVQLHQKLSIAQGHECWALSKFPTCYTLLDNYWDYSGIMGRNFGIENFARMENILDSFAYHILHIEAPSVTLNSSFDSEARTKTKLLEYSH